MPRWPLYVLTAAHDGTVTVTGPAAPSDPHPDRAAAVKAVSAIAARLSPARSVRAEARDDDGTCWPLTISPDGIATESGPPSRIRKATTRRTARKAGRTPAETDEHQAVAPSQIQQLLAQAHARQQEQEAAVPPAPVPPAPVPPAPAPPAAPVRQAPVQPPPQRPGRAEPVPTLLTIRRYADQGDLPRAAELARQLDDAVSAAHGPSHHHALEVRTLRADAHAALGELPAAITLYRDVAERYMYANDPSSASQIADRAHILWQQITDPRSAAAVGPSIVRMRAHIPGQGAYAQAQQYQTYLEQNARP